MKICYWSISWGSYSYMLQSLVNSFKRVGQEEDFHVFSDKKLKLAINHELNPNIILDNLQFFKFYYLKEEISKLNYDIFVFIDADHFFVRKPNINVNDILGSDPWHSFLESPINSITTKRNDWWQIKNHNLVKYFKQLGIENDEIRNTNGGFWICRKEFIEKAFELAFKCHNFLRSNNHIVPEEVSISYISHLSKNIKNRYAEKYFDYWASDWTGAFANSLPKNINWEWTSYMTLEKHLVNPAIVHGMRSKDYLLNDGRIILTN